VIEETDEEYRSNEDYDLCDFGGLAVEIENRPEDLRKRAISDDLANQNATDDETGP
jgi:hypothetical protein